MPTLDRGAILEAIRGLPLEEQREIAQEILRATSIVPLTPPSGRRGHLPPLTHAPHPL